MIKPPTVELIASITMLSASCVSFWERSGGILLAAIACNNFLDWFFTPFTRGYSYVEFLMGTLDGGPNCIFLYD
jgi:hypothetical protein